MPANTMTIQVLAYSSTRTSRCDPFSSTESLLCSSVPILSNSQPSPPSATGPQGERRHHHHNPCWHGALLVMGEPPSSGPPPQRTSQPLRPVSPESGERITRRRPR